MLAAQSVPIGLSTENLKVVELASGTSSEMFTASRPTGMRTSSADGTPNVSGTPADLDVVTRTGLAVRIRASSDDAAVQKSLHECVYPLTSILAARSGAPAFVDLRRLGIPDERGWVSESYSPYSATAVSYRPIQRPMAQSEVESVLDDLAMVKSDSTARVAAIDLSEGMRLRALHGGIEPLTAAAILRLFYVIERIAGAAPSVAVDETLQGEIVKRLTTVLSRKPAIRKRVSAVQAANRSLRVLEQKHLKDQILRASEMLGIESDKATLATKLADYRNRKLGHPNSAAHSQEHSRWLNDAERLAWVYFASYLDFLKEQKQSS